MARRKIRESDGRRLFSEFFSQENRTITVDKNSDLDELAKEHSWLTKEKLVVKPDMLMGKKGKNNLILLNADINKAKEFLAHHLGKEIEIKGIKGVLTHFVIQPFVEHDHEYFISIMSGREEDKIYLSAKGGVDIEENWDSVSELNVPVSGEFPKKELENALGSFPEERKNEMAQFTERMYKFFIDYDFSYLELNPFSFVGKEAVPLGFVGELDDCAAYKNYKLWGDLKFPQPFGKKLTKEEQEIKDLDSKTGASLKLTLLNPDGKIWPMIAGGGASVVYADTIVDLGGEEELAMYGEYSGNPNECETYQYASTILDLMTRNKRDGGKVLLIGGGIANFTDVAKTFKGIARALKEYKQKLQENKVKIYVRRGGPNYQTGLKLMKELGEELGVPLEVYGPETHMTKIVALALK